MTSATGFVAPTTEIELTTGVVAVLTADWATNCLLAEVMVKFPQFVQEQIDEETGEVTGERIVRNRQTIPDLLACYTPRLDADWWRAELPKLQPNEVFGLLAAGDIMRRVAETGGEGAEPEPFREE